MPEANSEGLRRWRALEQICALLTLSPSPPPSDVAEWDWDAFVELANVNAVATALARPLQALGCAPGEVTDYFHTLNELNARRNVLLEDALDPLLLGLEAAGIKSVLLKGAASLVDGLYDDPADRFLSDIDVLVASEHVEDAEQRLASMGYHARPSPVPARWTRPRPTISHQLPIMIHAASGVGVEIHRSAFKGELDPLLPGASIIARAQAVSWKGRTVLIPCATDRLIHNIGHDQLHHHRSDDGDCELRQLRELALIASRRGADVDWSYVEKQFERVGEGDVLREHAARCLAMLGWRLPIDQLPASEALARVRASVIGKTAPPPGAAEKLLQLAGAYASSFFRDPALALNLLNPVWWPQRWRGIKKLFGDQSGNG